MAIQPIDLQILFARINQVGKEVAAQRGATEIAQSVEGRELVRETEQKDHSVNLTKQLEDGAPSVRDDEEQNNPSGQGSGRRRNPESDEENGTEFFRDPDLGKNIDISG